MTTEVAQTRAVREGAGLFSLPERGLIRVRGRDRVRWLDGMLSAHIGALESGGQQSGCYALLLTPKGAIVADLHVSLLDEEIWLETAGEAIPRVLERLHRHIIADDVELDDASEGLHQLALEGSSSPAIISALTGAEDDLAPEACREIELAGHAVVCAAYGWSGEPARRLFMAPGAIDDVTRALGEAGSAHGLVPTRSDLLEVLRIEAGVPLLGAELDEDVLPDEARLGHAISTNKGCYVGQEIVARLRTRGHVNHLLVGFKFSGNAPPGPDTPVSVNGRKTGEVTSACSSPEVGAIGLGFVRREHAEPGTDVCAGEVTAVISKLPFVAHKGVAT